VILVFVVHNDIVEEPISQELEKLEEEHMDRHIVVCTLCLLHGHVLTFFVQLVLFSNHTWRLTNAIRISKPLSCPSGVFTII
jgi:hypothetical protein